MISVEEYLAASYEPECGWVLDPQFKILKTENLTLEVPLGDLA
jgi:hypothetical protein